MINKKLKLKPEQLYNSCDLSIFDFNKEEYNEKSNELIGQTRAMKAIRFGFAMPQKGYHIYVSGRTGTGRNSYVKIAAKNYAKTLKPAKDWCYVFNFKKPEEPLAISLNTGKGVLFKREIDVFIKKIRLEIPKLLNSKSFEDSKGKIYQQFEEMNNNMLGELNSVGEKYGFRFQMTERGLITYPLIEGRPMKEEELKDLEESIIEEMRKKSLELQNESFELITKVGNLESQLQNRLKQLKEKMVFDLLEVHLKILIDRFKDNKMVFKFLHDLEDDIIKNVDIFEKKTDNQKLNNYLEKEFYSRYFINLFVDNSEKEHAEVVIENNPNYYNLLGKIEYINDRGMLRTNHMKIKAGSLHQANGGILILQAKDLLLNPHSWQGLVRALKTAKIQVENMMGNNVVTSIKPQAIPIELKIVLVGDPYTYQMLYAYEDNFKKFFKIHADFDVEMKRSTENVRKIATFVERHCERENLMPFSKDALGKIVEYSSRIAGHQDKLTAQFNEMVEILYEANTLSIMDEKEEVNKKYIERAINERNNRNNKYEEHLMEYFKDDVLLIDTTGESVGQINGLAVLDSGQYSFGKPSRITVSSYLGKEGIVNIEREVEQSGSSHDKGVLIITGFLGTRYAKKYPLSLNANITFEQSYGMIDGDSASSTELYGLLSSLSDVPIKQSFAVTGSVNQKGQIQPIGGINEKIEGFYKVCKLKGLTGEQGIVMPYQNVKDLMLNDEVIDAVSNNKFHIYAVSTIDEGIEILTGVEAGSINEKNEYPTNSINGLVQAKLNKFAELLDQFEEEE